MKGCTFWPMLMQVMQLSIEQWGFFNVPHLSCDTGHPFNKWSSPRTRDTYIYCRAFNSGSVTNCFYDLSLLRLGFEHPTFPLQGERYNRLCHRSGRIENAMSFSCELVYWKKTPCIRVTRRTFLTRGVFREDEQFMWHQYGHHFKW